MPMWCVAPLEMNEGNSLGQGYNRPTAAVPKRPHTRRFNVFHNFIGYFSVGNHAVAAVWLHYRQVQVVLCLSGTSK